MSMTLEQVRAAKDRVRHALLRRLHIDMLLLLGTKSETEVSEWIRIWLKNWKPPQ